jgi:hypothetical protein
VHRPSRLLAVTVLVVCAVGLAVWIPYLGLTLDERYVVRRWSVAWVGLDVGEVLGLLGSAVLVHRRSRYAAIAAAATSASFLIDAWFDTTTSRQGQDYGESLVIALVAELPLGVVCACLAVVLTRHGADARGATGPAGSGRASGR